MKSKIIKTLVVLFLVIVVNSILELTTYSNSQVYSNLAPSQVNSDTTYYLMKTDISAYIIYVKFIVGMVIGYILYLIWNTKRKVE